MTAIFLDEETAQKILGLDATMDSFAFENLSTRSDIHSSIQASFFGLEVYIPSITNVGMKTDNFTAILVLIENCFHFFR